MFFSGLEHTSSVQNKTRIGNIMRDLGAVCSTLTSSLSLLTSQFQAPKGAESVCVYRQNWQILNRLPCYVVEDAVSIFINTILYAAGCADAADVRKLKKIARSATTAGFNFMFD